MRWTCGTLRKGFCWETEWNGLHAVVDAEASGAAGFAVDGGGWDDPPTFERDEIDCVDIEFVDVEFYADRKCRCRVIPAFGADDLFLSENMDLLEQMGLECLEDADLEEWRIDDD